MSKKRSAHRFFPFSQRPKISTPTNFIKISGMASIAEIPPTDSVMSQSSAGEQVVKNGKSSDPEESDHDLEGSHTDQIAAHRDAPHTPLKPKDVHPLKSHPITPSSDDDVGPPQPDFTRRGIHIPSRTSSTGKATVPRRRLLRTASTPTHSLRSRSIPTTPRPYSRADSSADSIRSYDSETSTMSAMTQTLVPLQQKGTPDIDRLSPLLEDDPTSFDLIAPAETELHKGEFPLEAQTDALFSREHLEAIFQDTPSLHQFTTFLSQSKPKIVPIFVYYLDALKALRAINYANAVAEALDPLEDHDFTQHPPRPTVNAILEEKARRAFDVLVRDALPAFITHVFTRVVSVSIQKRITGTLPPLLREASEGLAEVFCLSDPSRADNPIIFASDEFHRTTQYGVSFAIGRNCRFLQGPRTNRDTVARLSEAIREGKETSELVLNYRRDGSPFMNLLTVAPLLDSRGNLRYYIGAQIDVSGLVKDGTDLKAFQLMEGRNEDVGERDKKEASKEKQKEEFKELCEMFNMAELDTVRRFGGAMHRELLPDDNDRVLIKDASNINGGNRTEPSGEGPGIPAPNGRLAGVYKHYLLVRPSPSLRILFTSPSLRLPGILQSRLLSRIGGSPRVRNSLAAALADGTSGVTAKVRWLSIAASSLDGDEEDGGMEEGEGRPRWIHCTPLRGATGAVGVWMVVLVDVEDGRGNGNGNWNGNVSGSASAASGSIALRSRKLRPAPPVADTIPISIPFLEEREPERNRERERNGYPYAHDYDYAYPSRSLSRSPVNGFLNDVHDHLSGAESDDVFDIDMKALGMQKRSKRHSLPLLRSLAPAAVRRPGSAMSEQRGPSGSGLRARSEARTSVRSFALG